MEFNTKEIKYNGSKRIVLQNENGPCPLLAIANSLVLLDVLPITTDKITSDQLLQKLQKLAGPDLEPFKASLLEGLDANPRFDGSFDGQAPHLFALFGMSLAHGWVIPDDPDFAAARSLTYDDLTAKIVSESSDPGVLVAQSFIESHPSQLSPPGKEMLQNTLQNGDIVTLFRNNHFTTLVKHNNLLVTLVTDVGFARYGDIVWESLEGDFFEANFTERNDCSKDEELARQLQNEEHSRNQRPHSNSQKQTNRNVHKPGQPKAKQAASSPRSKSTCLIA